MVNFDNFKCFGSGILLFDRKNIVLWIVGLNRTKTSYDILHVYSTIE